MVSQAAGVGVLSGTKLSLDRFFTTGHQPVVEMFTWKTVDAVILDKDGSETFRQNGCDFPRDWSDRAIKIVAEKYFRVVNGVKEHSMRQVAGRVAQFISENGVAQGLLTPVAAGILHDELVFMVLDQRFAFNSPVWFNVGVDVDVKPQSSACFIQSVQDTMESIMDLQRKEVMLFKQGSGTGSNLSTLRSSYEKLKGGGFASGPVSFMKPIDKNAGVTKSGGTTRRAAKMVVMNMDHPDILVTRDGSPGFITCKSHAEQVAHDLYSTGKYSAEYNVPGNVYDLAEFQNANNSVRCSDKFMQSVLDDDVWYTKLVTDPSVQRGPYYSRDLWEEIAKAAWFCGDPGVQFDDTTNAWHTCPNSGRINASNPCGEFLYLDDTACNLASWNLLKFWDPKTRMFDVVGFAAGNEIAITAMEILVSASSYPSAEIEKNSHDFRPLGIGYANLGALLMHAGLGYDSNAGRSLASAITSLMSGTCYAQSARAAGVLGAFYGFAKNADAMNKVIQMHWDASIGVSPSSIAAAATRAWSEAASLGKLHGFRNAQISVMAPTGTISFMMDCATTGVEPQLDLIVYKKLVGGGMLKMPNEAVPVALRALGYGEGDVRELLNDVETTGGFRSRLKAEHKVIFQTAIGKDPVSVDGHLEMMAAIQPHISGGISKTVNLPSTATVKEVGDVYMRAWDLGLKCVALYRDGCKLSQPASGNNKTKEKQDPLTALRGVKVPADTAALAAFTAAMTATPGLVWGSRKRLPDERSGVIHKVSLGGQDVYIHVGLYDDGNPGEVFIDVAKSGSSLHGFTDMAAMLMSIGLQHGVPLPLLIDKLQGLKFEPDGITRNKQIPFASSIPDYLGKWLEKRFTTMDVKDGARNPVSGSHLPAPIAKQVDRSGPLCTQCGNITIRSGACNTCPNCGTTSGCG